MSVCENILRFNGAEDDLEAFYSKVKSLGKDFPQWFAGLEDQGADLTYLDSATPWVDSIHASVEPQAPGVPLDADITWQSNRYPSIQAVCKLSTLFPELVFSLDYDAYEDLDRGVYEVKNGELLEEDVVDYDAPIIDLLEEAGMLKLKPGEQIQVGTGMVDIECLDETPADDGGTIKNFSVRFQCDASPRFKVLIDKQGWPNYLEYSDDDGNDDIEDNGYADEMRGDLQ